MPPLRVSILDESGLDQRRAHRAGDALVLREVLSAVRSRRCVGESEGGLSES